VPGGDPVTVVVATVGEKGSVTFSGAPGNRISLEVTSVSIPFSYVSIRKPDGTDLVSRTAVFTQGKFIDTKVLPVAGTYTVTTRSKSLSARPAKTEQ
jgi:hypothetical protein